MRYSPKPLEEYTIPAVSQLTKRQPLLWNLMWLSWDWEEYPSPPDAVFSSVCYRSLDFDVGGQTIHDLMCKPAPYAALRILRCSRSTEIPLYQTYGADWISRLMGRSYRYTEPFDVRYDFPVTDVSTALHILQTCK